MYRFRQPSAKSLFGQNDTDEIAAEACHAAPRAAGAVTDRETVLRQQNFLIGKCDSVGTARLRRAQKKTPPGL